MLASGSEESTARRGVERLLSLPAAAGEELSELDVF
jgi:hypothetical protein